MAEAKTYGSKRSVGHSKSARSRWALALSIGAILSPGGALAQPKDASSGGLPSYHDRKFDVDTVRCVSSPQATCTFRVTAKIRDGWDYSERNGFIDQTGAFIGATSMAVGGKESSLPSREMAMIEAGTSAVVTLNFDRPIHHRDVQGLVVYIGHWSAKTTLLKAYFNP